MMREMYQTEQQDEEKQKPQYSLPQTQKNERNLTSDKDYLKAVDSLDTKRDNNDRKQTSPMTVQDEDNVRKAHIPRWVSKK